MTKIKKSIKKTAVDKFKAIWSGERVSSNTSAAVRLCDQSKFGELVGGKVSYALVEALFLIQKKKMDVYFGGKKLSDEKFIEKANKIEPNFLTRYLTFSDLRSKGYLVKTALKFGADFRVYDKGVKPGQAHAKWIVFPVYEGSGLTWHEFAAKNRVAHSTKKNLLIAIVDDEGAVTYYDSSWIKP